jgi:type II secretory pathway component PulF
VGDLARTKPLSAGDARQLAEQLATLTSSGLPLAQGFRAAAAECPSRHLRGAMETLAGKLESGQTLEDILTGDPRFLPQHVQQLLIAGVRAGNLPEVLARLIEIDRTSADLRNGIRQAVAYPFVVLALWAAIVVAFSLWAVPQIVAIYRDFRMNLPLSTVILLRISGPGALRLVAFLAAAIPMLLYGMRVSLKSQSWQRLLSEVPLFGPTIVYRGVANWARLFALVLRQNVPMPEAAKLAASGVDMPLMTIAGLRIAKSIAGGRKLADAITLVGSVPASIIPLVRWGEDHGALAEALDCVAEMFESRAKLRAALIHAVLPPLAFVVLAVGTFFVANATMSPLMGLIQDLSAGGRRRGASGGIGLSDGDFKDAMLGLLVLGSVWLALSIMFWSRKSALGYMLGELSGMRQPDRTTWRGVLLVLAKILFWLLTFWILAIVMIGLASEWGFLLWLATIVIAVMIAIRRGQMERRNLLWILSTAVDKGFPLSSAARSFADERDDRLGRRVRRLALSLDGGARLDTALAEARIRLPIDALVAVRTGSRRGGLATLLKTSVRQAGQLDAPVHAAAGRFIYLSSLILFSAFVLAFVMIKIVPAYEHIFSDFKTNLPPATLLFRNVSHAMVNYWFFIFPAFLLLLGLMIFAIARYAGLTNLDPPILRRLSRPLDQALILQTLAESVDQQSTLIETLDVLAVDYPKAYIRRPLQESFRQIEAGVDWRDALCRNGLLPAAEAAVLKAAQRAGNLAWAMREMADRLTRKFTQRLAVCLSVGFPAVIFVLGLLTGWFALAMIYPLAKLILDLSGGHGH